ncbi:hypothetical protein L218DRAFT_954939 [Marasmius fiardii PR-910]|nr:hypothetical protein L218DRAFT_954939 [Marasmius fiardii PR-910]
MEHKNSLPSPVSEKEAQLYYYSLPSNPRLVARSNILTKPWTEPPSDGSEPKCKALRPVGYKHKIVRVMGQFVSPRLRNPGLKTGGLDRHRPRPYC